MPLTPDERTAVDTSLNKSVLPFTTGSPGMDSLVRSGLIAASIGATGLIVGFLNAHGFRDPNLPVYVGGAVLGVFGGIFGAAWGWLQQKKAKTVIAQHIVQAAVSGTAPPAAIAEVKKVAPALAEEAETAALNKAQLKNGT